MALNKEQEDSIRAAAEAAAEKAVARALREWFNTGDAAEYLGYSTEYLEIARCRGEGPVYSKPGRSVRYRRADLDAFMLAHRRGGAS